MSKLIPEVQIGTLGGTLIWIALALVIIIALFTTGLGPVVVAGLVAAVFVVIAYFAFSRVFFRLKRGTR